MEDTLPPETKQWSGGDSTTVCKYFGVSDYLGRCFKQLGSVGSREDRDEFLGHLNLGWKLKVA